MKVRARPLSAAPSAAANARPNSLAERAYVEIRNQILKGDLPVGVALARRKLAADLGVSVPPVSEALQRLEREGLVESKPRVGTRVKVPTRQEVEDRSLVREALESQAARLFAERATDEEKDELRRMGLRVDQLYAASEGCAECARCPALRDAIEKEQVLIFNWLYDTAVQRKTLASDFHTRLTDVLAQSGPLQADEAMREHIRRGLKEVLSGFERMIDAESGWRHKK